MSFFHGSNDGQKGMGLIMLILIGVLPGAYALNLDTSPTQMAQIMATAQAAQPVFDQNAKVQGLSPQVSADILGTFLKTTGKFNDSTYAALGTVDRDVCARLAAVVDFQALPREDRKGVRSSMSI